jgi:hypothetical protein
MPSINSLIVKFGVLMNQYSLTSYRPKVARETTTWKDGTLLVTTRLNDALGTLVPDPRTQGPIGSVLYTTAYADEEIIYYEQVFPREELDVRDFGLSGKTPDCSPLWEALSNYFPPSLPQCFLFQPGTTYTFKTGLKVDSRGHRLFAPNPKRPAVVSVPGGITSLESYGPNGTTGLQIENFRFGASSQVKDGAADQDGNVYPSTDIRSDDPYACLYHGALISNVVQFKNVEFGGFSGNGLKAIAYIDPNSTYTANTSLSTFIGLKITGCGGDGILINGADANHMLFMDLDIRDNVGFGYTDDSLLGNHVMFAHFNNNKRGTFRVRGPGNSALLNMIYTEEIQDYLTLPSTNKEKGYGGYLYGNAKLSGGTVSPEGSGMPGSKVFCYNQAEACVGSFSSGISFGTVSIGKGGLYFNGGLTFTPVNEAEGYRYHQGSSFTGNIAEYLTRNLSLAQTGRPAQSDAVNLVTPFINGNRHLLVRVYEELTTYKNQSGDNFTFFAGDRITEHYPNAWRPLALLCVGGGQYRDDYTTSMTLTPTARIDGNYEHVFSGTDPIPAIGSFITVAGIGPFQVAGRGLDPRAITLAPSSLPITGGSHAVGYAKPTFRPEGAGSGSTEQRPDLTGYGGPWQYWNTSTNTLQTWTGTNWIG